MVGWHGFSHVISKKDSVFVILSISLNWSSWSAWRRTREVNFENFRLSVPTLLLHRFVPTLPTIIWFRPTWSAILLTCWTRGKSFRARLFAKLPQRSRTQTKPFMWCYTGLSLALSLPLSLFGSIPLRLVPGTPTQPKNPTMKARKRAGGISWRAQKTQSPRPARRGEDADDNTGWLCGSVTRAESKDRAILREPGTHKQQASPRGNVRRPTS